MKKVIIAPDSFKGSITSLRFCEIAKNEINKIMPQTEVITLPVADGGEGTLDSLFTVLGGSVHNITVKNALFEDVEVKILFLNNGKTAVIEAAQCIGLPQIKGSENPEITSTFGMGQMIEYAANNQAEEIILALGGSSTNDCGAGMLSAIGIKYINKDGKVFVPTGITLKDVVKIEADDCFDKYKTVKFKAMCDVKNPLYGAMGCSFVFARQKGADDNMIKRLEESVIKYSETCRYYLKDDYSEVEGAGAAGGLGFACKAFLKGELISGIEILLSLYNYDLLKKDADLVITGEGSFDKQSLMGKAVGGIVVRSKNIPVAVMCGRFVPFDYSVYSNIKHVISISGNDDLETAIKNAENNLKNSIKNLFTLI